MDARRAEIFEHGGKSAKGQAQSKTLARPTSTIRISARSWTAPVPWRFRSSRPFVTATLQKEIEFRRFVVSIRRRFDTATDRWILKTWLEK